MKIPFKLRQILHLPSLRGLLRWLIYGISVVLIMALISWLAVPPLLKSTLEQQVAVQTGRQFTVQRVAFNPFKLSVALSGINLHEADGKSRAFSVDEIIIKISPSSLFRFAPVVRELVVRYPHLNLVRKQHDGKEVTNFSDVTAKLAAQPSRGEPMQYSISNIQIMDGVIHLDDQIVKQHIHIEDIKLGLPFLSNFSKAVDTFVAPGLSARVNGSLFELKGRSKPFTATRETSLDINLKQLDLTKLFAFSPTPLPFKLNSAHLSSALSLKFSSQKDATSAATITLSGNASLNNVVLSDIDGKPLAKVKAIEINVHEADLIKQQFSLNSLAIKDPELWAQLNSSGKLNWLVLPTNKASSSVDKVKSLPSNPPIAHTPPKSTIDITQFHVKNGTVHWFDAANATPAMEISLSKLNIDAQKLSTQERAGPASIKLSVGQEHQQQIQWVGDVDLVHPSASGQITLSDVSLADYQPYINRVLAAKAAGKLSLTSQFVAQTDGIRLKQLSGALSYLSLQASDHEPQQKAKRKNKGNVASNIGANGGITAKKIAIENASVDTKAKQATIEKIVLNHVQGNVFRDVEGKIKLRDMLKQDAKNNDTDKDNPSSTQQWKADINQIAFNDSNFVFNDQSTNPVVNIRADGIDGRIEKLSSTFDHPFNLTLRAHLNKTGKVAMAGLVGQKSVQLDLDLQSFSVVALQPYFAEFLNVTLEKGAVSSKGKLNWTAPEDIQYQGDFKVANFSSTDKETANTFLKWKALKVGAVDIGLKPKHQKIALGKIDINDFYARAILSEQGRLNLQNIVVREHDENVGRKTNGTVSSSTTSEASGAAIVPVSSEKNNQSDQIIKIGQVNLNNGVINYTDNFIKPRYSMRMTGMNGTIGTIQSSVVQAAPINLNGKIDNDAPIFISGSLNPLIAPILLDIKMTATGIDLPRLTTYSAKYAGYPIEKGKLSLDVAYHVKDHQLTANNTLKIDQLTFGEKVESPDATDLPVLLAVSLLADRNGQINLDVPIAGTLNDPEFSLGGVIMKVFLNLIGKVITSPFSLLARAIPGGEELSYVEFASGSTTLSDATKTKLDGLAKALEERPNVKLDIMGRADLDTDAQGLRERKLARQIKKRYELKDTDDKDDVAAQSIPEAERTHIINSIYAAARFEKPTYQIGIAKLLPPAEMEKLILQNTPIGEDDLRSLANRRASVVRNYLTDVAHVPLERIYMIAPKVNAVDSSEEKQKGANVDAAKGSAARVDFSLKM